MCNNYKAFLYEVKHLFWFETVETVEKVRQLIALVLKFTTGHASPNLSLVEGTSRADPAAGLPESHRFPKSTSEGNRVVNVVKGFYGFGWRISCI